MKIKDFDVDKIKLLLSYFPQDLELKTIDFSNDDIQFSFQADYKQALADKRDKSAMELFNMLHDLDERQKERELLIANNPELLNDKNVKRPRGRPRKNTA